MGLTAPVSIVSISDTTELSNLSQLVQDKKGKERASLKTAYLNLVSYGKVKINPLQAHTTSIQPVAIRDE